MFYIAAGSVNLLLSMLPVNDFSILLFRLSCSDERFCCLEMFPTELFVGTFIVRKHMGFFLNETISSE